MMPNRIRIAPTVYTSKQKVRMEACKVIQEKKKKKKKKRKSDRVDNKP